jgi:uncharacterized delta-60 repeat protein
LTDVKRMKRLPFASVCALAIVLLPSAASAAPGDLDPSFNGRGYVAASFPAPTTFENVEDVDVTSTRIFAAANASRGPQILAFTHGGRADQSFGTDGRVSLGEGEINGLAALASGKLVVLVSRPGAVEVSRLTQSGALDTSFGEGGRVRFEGPIDFWASPRLHIDEQERVLLSPAGHLARLTAAGLPDPSFSGDGTADHLGRFADFGITADGRPVALEVNCCASDYALVRVTDEGEADTSFGVGGRIEAEMPPTAVADRLLVDPRGPIIVGALHDFQLYGPRASVIQRHDADGALVPEFSTDFSNSAGNSSFLLDDQQRLLFAGTTDAWEICWERFAPRHDCYDMKIGRTDAVGQPDPAFGGGGRRWINLRYREPNGAHSLALDQQGRMVIGGFSGRDLVITRILTAPGPADRDADRVLDGDDACVATFSLRSDGCPRFPRKLSLSRPRKRDGGLRFGGSLASRRHFCLKGRVVIKQRRRGTDRVIARTKTLRRRSWDDPTKVTFKVGSSKKLGKRPRRMRFYGVVRPLSTTAGHCLGARARVPRR